MRGDDELGTDEGTTKLELLKAEKNWVRLPTCLLGLLESWAGEERAKTQQLKAAWAPLQTQVMGYPEVVLVEEALEAAADADPWVATSGWGIL